MADDDKPRDPAPAPTAGAARPEVPGTTESGAPKPEPAGSDATGAQSEGSTSDSSPTYRATTPVWWEWVGRHRKQVGIVAALVVLAVVATVVTVSVVTPGPKDVVQSYMDALQEGDTQAALDIVGKPKDDFRLRFLSADALADDWTVTSVVELHRRDDEADVDVTIASGDISEQGRFHVVKGEDGWRIEAPFVWVDLVVRGIDTIELGRAREAVPGDTREGRPVSLLLFPGAYDLYPSLADHVTFDPGVLIAAPQPSVDQPTRLTVGYTVTEKGTAAANEVLADRVEECAATPDRASLGCPFDKWKDRVLLGYSDAVDVTWAVTSPPKARFVPTSGGGQEIVVHTPGRATVTGKGIPYEPEGAAPEPFTVTCEFGVGGMAVAVDVDAETVFSVVDRPYAVDDETICFQNG